MNKSVEIENRMREYIRAGVWTADRRIPSEAELCGHFGVSRTTVRTALNSLRSQGRLISRPALGTVVAAGRRTLHLMVGSSASMADVVFMKNLVLFGGRRPGFEIRLHSAEGNPVREAAILSELVAEPGSFIFMTRIFGDAARRIIVDNPGRIAILGSAPELLGACCQIQTDLQAGTEMVMNHIIGLGHRRIAYFGPYCDGCRYLQYRTCMTRNGLGPDPELSLVLESGDVDRRIGAPRQAHGFLKKILDLKEPATAVVCASDILAMDMFQAALAADVRVPERLSVAGLDGADAAETDFGDCSITAAVRPFESIFTAAVNLLENFKNENPRVLVRPDLHTGNTVANVKNNKNKGE